MKKYCPMHEKRPEVKIEGFRFYDETAEPEICQGCRENNRKLVDQFKEDQKAKTAPQPP